MNKYGIEVGDRFLLPFRYVNAINCCPTENNDFAIVKQRCETRVEVFCDQNEQFVYTTIGLSQITVRCLRL